MILYFNMAVNCKIYNEQKLNDLIKDLDVNGDGKIDYQEFITNYFVFKDFDNSRFIGPLSIEDSSSIFIFSALSF